MERDQTHFVELVQNLRETPLTRGQEGMGHTFFSSGFFFGHIIYGFDPYSTLPTYYMQ